MKHFFFFFFGLAYTITVEAATLMVKIDFIEQEHEIVKTWLIDQDFPSSFHLKGRNDDIQFNVLDKKSRAISTYFANRIAPVSCAHILATDEEKQRLGHQHLTHNKGSYYLRIPNYQPNMQAIRLSYRPKIEPTRTLTQVANSLVMKTESKTNSLAHLQLKK